MRRSQWSWERTPRTDKFYQGPPDEETRQPVATARLREFRRRFPDSDFTQLLTAFRRYGELYDQGWRLRDGRAVA